MRSSFKKKTSWALDRSVLVSTIAINFLSLATPLAVLLVFDRVIPNASMETLRVLTIGLVLVAVVEFVFQYARSALLGFSASRNAVKNHLLYLSCVLNSNTNEFAKSDTATHLERYAAVNTLRNQQAGEAQTLIIDLPFTGLFIAMIWFVGGPLVVVPIACFGTVMLFAVLVRRRQRRIFEKRQMLDQRRYSFLAEVLSSVAVTKANTMERQFMRRFEMLQHKAAHTSEELIRLTGLSQSFGAVLGQAAIAATGIFGAFLVINSRIGMAELAACMLLNGRVIQPSMRILKLWVQTEATRSAIGRLDEVLALPANKHSKTNQNSEGRLEFRKLSSPSISGVRPVFSNLSASIQPGQFVLIEATEEQAIPVLFSMVLGQSNPSAGCIYLDGYLPKDRLAERGYQSIVALDKQPTIFTGTIIENISAFSTGEQVERAKAFAAELGLEQRIHRLPDGYNTNLNTGGFFEREESNRQLISLVRALAMQPKILLMHEPSALLETPERQALGHCLSKLECRPTLLLASPDPRLRELADQKLTLDASLKQDVRAWEADKFNDIKSVDLARGAA